MVEAMAQCLARDADAELGHFGEVGQALLSRRVDLTEHHLALGTIQAAPGAQRALERAAQPRPVTVGMAAPHLLKQGDGAQARAALE